MIFRASLNTKLMMQGLNCGDTTPECTLRIQPLGLSGAIASNETTSPLHRRATISWTCTAIGIYPIPQRGPLGGSRRPRQTKKGLLLPACSVAPLSLPLQASSPSSSYPRPPAGHPPVRHRHAVPPPRLHGPLASPLRLRLRSPLSSSATPGGFLLCSGHAGARRLHVALAADNRVVLGCGLVTLDYLATVDAYPRPDDKIRTGELQISGGGNAGNALTAAARLGLNTRVISKVGNDETGGTVLSELNEAGIDTSHVIISDGGNTTFVYIIIDKQTKTRTCILTPGEPQMVPSDLSVSSLSAALQDVSLLYLDGYSPEVALAVAKQADQMKIPILVDAEQERTKEELEGLLSVASFIVCSGKFPKNWTSIPSLPCALLMILLQYPRAKFVIATLGEKGCMMLERSEAGDGYVLDAADIEVVTDSLKLELHKDDALPTCVSSKFMGLSARGLGSIFGRLLIGTEEAIPASELVDTTGCGDAFIGAVLHALSTEMPPEKMLPFASQVAGIKCRAIGARAGLPWRSDQRLAKYL